MGAIIKTISTKNDIKYELSDIIYELAELRQDIRKAKTEIIWWMFFFSLANVASTFAIFYFFLKQ
jgi:hypothetical protein